MIFVFETVSISTLRSIAVSIPESAGLLVFGVGLVLVAVLLRSLFAKTVKQNSDERVEKEA